MRARLLATLLPCLLVACIPAESEDDGSGPSGPVCTATYQGPLGTTNGVPHRCTLIYQQRCKDDNVSTANSNCAYGMTAQEAAECPYCP